TDLSAHFQNMAYALLVAYKSLCLKEVPVGCIYYHTPTQKVIATGYNDTNASLCGTRHAEFIALEKILAQKQFKDNREVVEYMHGVVLYVTVEPCVMCASALKQLGLKKIYFGCLNDRFGGNGSVLNINRRQTPQDASTYVSYPGIFRLEAVLLLRQFYNQVNPNAPQPKIKKSYNVFKLEFPQLNYKLYTSRDEFVETYGEGRAHMYD
ncbi:hypothetical protein BABINDRAFT_20086, partial [Babjeviella inositovora NRRL Y-12698]